MKRNKEWFPEEGHRERPSQNWKIAMGCAETHTCSECRKVFVLRTKKEQLALKEQQAKEYDEHRTHKPEDPATCKPKEEGNRLQNPYNEHKYQTVPNCRDYQQLQT